MNEIVRFVLSTTTVQWAGSLLMAAVLFSFWRSYGRDYLFHISMSWLALSFAFFGGGVSMWAASQAFPAAGVARLTSTAVSQIAGYLQVVLLLVGTTEIVSRHTITRRRMAILTTVCVAVGLAATLAYATDPTAYTERYFIRFGLRALIVGLSFLIGGILVFKYRNVGRLGPRLVAGAFVLYGLQQLHYFLLVTRQLLTGFEAPYLAYLTFVDFFLLVVMGLGVVVWLLEVERDRLAVANREIDFLSNFDSLTGLPNRQQLQSRLDRLLKEAKTSGEGVAVVAIALDDFSAIVDSLGRSAGDEIVRTAAARLGREVDGLAAVARSGPQEFVIVIRDVGGRRSLRGRLDTLMKAMRRPFDPEGHELYASVSVGAAYVRPGTDDAVGVLRCAEVALHSMQRSGRDGYVIYSPKLGGLSADRLRFESTLRRAVEKRQFVLHFQPIVSLDGHEFVGGEALVRWRHPSRGILPPGEFLGIAESIGTLKHIDWWVLDQACRTMNRWLHRGCRDLSVSINVSPQRFQDPEFVERLQSIVESNGVKPEHIQLEITEGSALQQSEQTLGTLRRLRTAGFRIAIDDFGVGYSSLSNLRNVPVDFLKIDRSFVQNLGISSRDEAFVASIITLAHGLDIPVIAEGVESDRQRLALQRLGCDYAQGFLFSHPLPEDRYADIVDGGELPWAQRPGASA